MHVDVDGYFAQTQNALRHDIASFLDEHGFSPASTLGADMLCLLRAPGKLLSPTPISTRLPQGYWALLPLTLAHYCQPEADSALLLRVAVACELQMCALDYFDELEDDDRSAERRQLGDGRLLNAAYTLSVLARQALATLSPSLLALPKRLQVLAVMDEELLVAVQGQHRDLLMEAYSMSDVTPEECLDIATAKAGALVRLVCRLAVTAVDASDEVMRCFSQVGEYIGTASQIENDAHDLEGQLSPAEMNGKSDLARAKKTLPILFAAQQYASLQYSRSSSDSERQEQQDDLVLLKRAYEDAIAAALGCAIYLRKEARRVCLHIEELLGRPQPHELHILLGIETH